MLQDIRDNSQGFIAKVIVGLIVAVFALFGIESVIGGFIRTPPVAEVNGEEITEAQLQRSTQSLLNSIGGGADLEQTLIEQLALSQLIEETLLQQAAGRATMRVSSDKIDRTILQNPGFQINGVFDPDLAIRTMAVQGYSVELYREALTQSLVLGQLANGFASSGFITDQELESIARLAEQTRDFRYVAIPLGTRTLDTPISDAAIENYYNANPDRFIQEETVVLQYVSLDKDAIAEEIDIPEEELLARYEAEQAEFEGGAERRAAHILFEIGLNETEEEVLEAAAEVMQRIDAGEDFGELALEYSADTFSAQQGGDIGYSDGSVFPEAVEAALAGLSLNEVSEPLVSEFGVHIVKLTEDSVRQFDSFEAVSPRITRDLQRAEVELIYAERLEDLSNLAFETGDLASISEQLGLEIRLSEPVGRQGGRGLFSDPAVIDAAFSDSVLLEGNNSDPIELENEAIVLRLQQFNEASVPPLEDVRAEISVLLRTDLERQAVQAIGEQLLMAVDTTNATTTNATKSIGINEADQSDDANEMDESNATVESDGANLANTTTEPNSTDGTDAPDAILESNEANVVAANGTLDSLLAEQQLAWVDAPATNRNAFSVNREIVDHVFTLPAPEAGETRYSSITLSNDTFVLIELQNVTPGNLESVDEFTRQSLISAMQTDLGRSDFASYVQSLKDTADIDAPMLEEIPFP